MYFIAHFADLEKATMFNPIISEVFAHEQRNDRLREAEQYRLVKATIARQSADRSALRTYVDDLLIAVRHMFKTAVLGSLTAKGGNV
jgi:hypothetical protein